jgi:hypothetical protein
LQSSSFSSTVLSILQIQDDLPEVDDRKYAESLLGLVTELLKASRDALDEKDAELAREKRLVSYHTSLTLLLDECT